MLIYSHKDDDAGVGHGKGKSQNTTAHDGIAEVEDRHTERGLALKLEERRKIKTSSHYTNLTNLSITSLLMTGTFTTSCSQNPHVCKL